MTCTVGTIDRTLGAALGAGLGYLAVFNGPPGFDGTILGYVGAAILMVAATRICPIFNVNHCRV